MPHLHLVTHWKAGTDLFEVTITNPHHASMIYTNIIAARFELSGDYPQGVLFMTRETGVQVIAEYRPGDRMEGAHFSVEAA